MIPLRLELKNFLPYKDPAPLDFSGLHVACLTGENGAGKSSLLDAITWALWGKARSSLVDGLIHQGQTEMRVALTFGVGTEVYQVIRQRKAGKVGQAVLELQTLADGKWRGMSEDTITKTQRKIVRVLRLDYETFINSAFIMQGRADEFTVKAPAERKKVLADILGLDQWERYEERAKDLCDKAEEAIRILDSQLADVEKELGRRAEYERELTAAQSVALELANRVQAAEREWHDLEQARQLLIGFQRQIDDITRTIVRAEQDLREADHELAGARAKADTAALKQELASAQFALTELDAREAERDQITASRQNLSTTLGELRGVNQVFQAEAETLKQRIIALQAAAEPLCPTCGQPLAESERDKLVADLGNEVTARRDKYRDNKARIDALNMELTGMERALSTAAAELRQRLNWQKKVAELTAGLDQADEARQAVARVEARRERWLANLAADRAERDKLNVEADKLEREVRASGNKQQELERLRLDQRMATERVGAAQQRLRTLDNFARQREARLADRAKRAEEQGIYEELRRAFGKRGVPAMIIEAAVPEIEETANGLLTRMTTGKMHLRLDTQREIKTGELREALDINIGDELGTRPYENYSGGEQFRINFAIRLALSKLLARRAGAQLQTLVIDEGFGTQDAQGRERLVAAINAVQNDFERILVITHIDELKDAFPARIDITKTDNGSQISIG